MTEPRLQVFAEVAEARVPLPDLRELESRGKDLRRTRRAAAAAAAVVVVVAGVALAWSAGPDGPVEPVGVPSPAPSDRGVQELSTRPQDNERLYPGADYRVRPAQSGFEQGVEATFTGQGADWFWFGDGAIRTASGTSPQDVPGGDVPSDLPRVPYAEFGVMHADKVALGQCDLSDPDPWWGDLVNDPLRAAGQIALVPGVTRLGGPPEVDDRFGHAAAHVQLSVPRVCPRVNDVVLWRLHPYINGGHPGVGTVLHAGQVLDVWVVNVEGALVIVYVERSPGLPSEYAAEAFALLGSLELSPAVGR